MAKKRIIILGAGLAGLSAAWHLQKKGQACQIFEKESEAGGLCRSKKKNGFIFDYDGHLLHFKERYTFDLVRELAGKNLSQHTRSSWVWINSRYIPYPFQANLFALPPEIIEECLLGFIQAGKNGFAKKRNPTFLDWIYHAFGAGIARHFMVPYNKKFWTVHPRELTCQWLEGIIPVPRLDDLVEGTLEQSRKLFGYNSHFWYPNCGGIEELPKAFCSELKNIRTNCSVEAIDIKRKETFLSTGERARFDYLISTLPLPEMARLIKGLPKEIAKLFLRLRWNSIFNYNIGINRQLDKNKHWVYFPGEEPCFFRAGFYHNFSASLAPQGKGSIYSEVSYSKDKPINKKNMAQRIKSGLKKAGIIKEGDQVCAEDINDIEYGYPIYDKAYSRVMPKITRYLLGHNIIPCGRYGSWKYLSMEGAILEGKRAAAIP